VTATAIALKKIIHFRILTPSVNLRSYARRLKTPVTKIGGYRAALRWARWTSKVEKANVTIRDNATVV
jgi:hypothetical protein